MRNMSVSQKELFDDFFEKLKKQSHHPLGIANKNVSIDNKIKSDEKIVLSDSLIVDIVIVFALKNPEREMFQKALGVNYIDDVKNGVAFRVFEIKLNSRTIRIAVATQREMGMVSSAITSTISLMTYKPKLIIMGGICAGVEGKVNIGDVVVANPTFNHEAGKRTESGFEANYTHRSLQRNIDDICQSISEDRELLRTIRDSWDFSTGKPNTELSVHIVPMGSGSSVITEKDTIEKIAIHNRKITGLDMEAFAVAQSAYEVLGSETPWLVAKGVQDHANSEKNDNNREYAAFVSAKFIIEFIKRYFA